MLTVIFKWFSFNKLNIRLFIDVYIVQSATSLFEEMIHPTIIIMSSNIYSQKSYEYAVFSIFGGF